MGYTVLTKRYNEYWSYISSFYHLYKANVLEYYSTVMLTVLHKYVMYESSNGIK